GHAGPLPALAGEDEDRAPAGLAGRRGDGAVGGGAPPPPAPRPPERGAGGARDGGAGPPGGAGGPQGGPPGAGRQGPRRPRGRAASRPAGARSASGVRADSSQGTAGRPGPSSPCVEDGAVVPPAGSSGSGPCSSTTWALVPLTPKAETPARRGRPVAGQVRFSA